MLIDMGNYNCGDIESLNQFNNSDALLCLGGGGALPALLQRDAGAGPASAGGGGGGPGAAALGGALAQVRHHTRPPLHRLSARSLVNQPPSQAVLVGRPAGHTCKPNHIQ